MQKLRVGFVGCGGIAHRHLGVLETFEDVAVVAVADPDLQRAEAAAARDRAHALSPATTRCSPRRSSTRSGSACRPSPMARRSGRRSPRGLPFFVEKPLSLDAELAREIDEAVRRRRARHRRRLPLALSRHGRRGAPAAARQPGAPDVRLLARPDAAARVVVARGPLRRADRRAGDPRHRPRALPGRRRHRGLRHGRPARPRASSRGLDVATASTATLRFASGAIANLSATCLLRWGHRVGLHVFADALAHRADRPRHDGRRRTRPADARRRGRPGLARGSRLRRRGAGRREPDPRRPTPRRSRRIWSPSPSPARPARARRSGWRGCGLTRSRSFAPRLPRTPDVA